MKSIVTGGCGFIGSHLTELLLQEGHEVLVIDNLSTGRLLNIEHLNYFKSLKFVQADISEYNIIESHFKGIDWVFHIAALADIIPSIEQPLKYHKANVDGTIAVLEASRKNNIRHLVYAASSSCYGIPEVYPTPETAPIKPQYPYAITKNLGEQYVMYWNQVYKLPVSSLRFFNVYGPRSRTSGTYGAVFGVFLAQKLNNKPFTIVGDGTQTRDFTYVSDIANACYTAVQSEKAVGQIFNVGSGNTYSVNLLTQLLGGDVIYIPKRPGEPDCTFADITNIKSVLNWNPRISFKEGVQTMLNNIEYWRKAPLWDPGSIEVATRDWFKFLGK
jgi:UDP-glucose 4-epimerase